MFASVFYRKTLKFATSIGNCNSLKVDIFLELSRFYISNSKYCIEFRQKCTQSLNVILGRFYAK